MSDAYKIILGGPQRKRPLETRRRREENNIKMNTEETGCQDVDGVHLSQDRVQWWVLVNTFPQKEGNFLII
jgi:hypothetical protein